MVQSGWTPTVAEGSAPLWQRLVDALAEDIATGAMRCGARLPPHRELAYRLGIGVGTVSRAYAEAERLGLVSSHVGRGTFATGRRKIASPARTPSGRLDLARNVPPIGPALAVLDQTLEAVRRRKDAGAIFDYTFTAGLPAVREAGAAWLKRQGGVSRARAARLIQTNGGQHALSMVCSCLARPGETILCDPATYPGNRTIAEQGGWRLHGVPSDGRGMSPEALDKAAAETGAHAVLLIPTLHNPTAITLDAARREEIASVARARDLTIIEDDIYRAFGREEEPPPFAELAPERTVHIASLSKALSPGLRLGFILLPEDQALSENLLLAAQASCYCPPAFGGLVFAQWMESGLAERILEEVRSEMERRNLLARDLLGEAMAEPHSAHSLHVWLPMEAERAGRTFAQALRADVELTPPDAPFVDPGQVSGLRICLGTPIQFEALAHGLRVVKAALEDEGPADARGIV